MAEENTEEILPTKCNYISIDTSSYHTCIHVRGSVRMTSGTSKDNQDKGALASRFAA